MSNFRWSQTSSFGIKSSYVLHIGIPLCCFLYMCRSLAGHCLIGAPTSLQCDSCCRCHSTTLFTDKIMSKIRYKFHVCLCSPGKIQIQKAHTRWIAFEVATASAQTSAPQLEARLGHPLPFSAHFMVGGSKGIVTRVLSGRHSLLDWRDRTHCVSFSSNVNTNEHNVFWISRIPVLHLWGCQYV